MRTVFIILIIFLLIATTTTALEQVQVMDDGYMAAKENYKIVNVPGETYWQEIEPSFENAKLINDTLNIIVDQNHAGYLVFDISNLDKIGPDNTAVVKLYLDDTQPTAETKFNSNPLSVYVAGPYPTIKGDKSKSTMESAKNYAGSNRGPGTAMLADITQTVVNLQEFGVAKVILRLEPVSIRDMNMATVYKLVQIKTLESGHPAEIIII
jgi:hypothetical protein